MSANGDVGAPARNQAWSLYGSGRRRLFLAILFLVGTCNYIDRNIITVLLEPIRIEFGLSDTHLGLLSGIAFAFFYATLGIPIARWADRGDRRKVLAVSLSIWSAMTILCGLSRTFWQLLLARFGVGAGEAGALPPAQSLIADYYPPARRASAIGIFMMSSALGYAIGLVLGGHVAQSFGWRAAFLLVGCAGLLLAPVCLIGLAEPRKQPSLRDTQAGESLACAARALAAKPAFRYFLGAIIIHYLMGYGAFIFLVSLLIRLHGLRVDEAGTAFGIVSAGGALAGNFLGGRMADRLARRNLSNLPKAAGWTMIVSVPVFEAAIMSSDLRIMLLMLAAAMVVLNMIVPPLFSSLHAICGSARRATAVAVSLFFANLIGVGGGPVVTGLLSDAFAPGLGAGEGLRLALMIVILVMIPGGILMLRASYHFATDAED